MIEFFKTYSGVYIFVGGPAPTTTPLKLPLESKSLRGLSLESHIYGTSAYRRSAYVALAKGALAYGIWT